MNLDFLCRARARRPRLRPISRRPGHAPAVPLVALASALLAGCVPPHTVSGVTASPPSPQSTWTPAADAGAPLHGTQMAGAEPSADTAAHLGTLGLADVIDQALRNSPQTRASWAQARAADASYGSARGRYLPAVDLTAAGGPSRSISQNPARIPANRTTFNAALSLQYVLLDFGSRGGSLSAAREGLFAADLAHNAAVQSVVLQAETAYFGYQAARGLLVAAHQTVQTAQANLAAAERRHDVGLATIADVLQARTALAQSQLAEQSADGNVQAARAQLALTLGLDANAPFDVAPDTGATPVSRVADNVDSLIARAVLGRPDVAAARAVARQSEAEVRVARSETLPSVTVGSTTGKSFSNNQNLEGRTYTVTFGLSVPLFNGLSRENDVAAANALASAAAARAEETRLQAVAQVFTSYYALQTATQRVSTSADLLASATRSEEVAVGRYAEGVGTILDLLTAQTVLADARAQSVQARWTWYAALAQLARDAGVLGTHGEPNLTLTAGARGTNR